jgi:hypothetical protein
MSRIKITERYEGREYSTQLAVSNVLNDVDYDSGALSATYQQSQELIRVISILCEILVINGVLNKDQLQSILGWRYKVE